MAEETGRGDGKAVESVVNSLVKLRSSVRFRSLQGLKNFKRIQKERGSADGGGGTDGGVEEAYTACSAVLKGVLGDCDAAREELLRGSGVEIKDIGDRSTWTFEDDKV